MQILTAKLIFLPLCHRETTAKSETTDLIVQRNTISYYVFEVDVIVKIS